MDEQARERFIAEGACGGQYAIVWDREQQQIVFPYLRTGANLSDDQIRTVASELNALLARVRNDALEYAAQLADEHWPESGHIHIEDAVSCQMSISIAIRKAKTIKDWEATEHEKLAVAKARLAEAEWWAHNWYGENIGLTGKALETHREQCRDCLRLASLRQSAGEGK